MSIHLRSTLPTDQEILEMKKIEDAEYQNYLKVANYIECIARLIDEDFGEAFMDYHECSDDEKYLQCETTAKKIVEYQQEKYK
jgi:hypothetical protein